MEKIPIAAIGLRKKRHTLDLCGRHNQATCGSNLDKSGMPCMWNTFKNKCQKFKAEDAANNAAGNHFWFVSFCLYDFFSFRV